MFVTVAFPFIAISEEQIRWVFDDNRKIIFVSSPKKHMLRVLIRIASASDSNEYPQHTFIWRNKQNYPLIITKYSPYFSTEFMTAGLHQCFY